MADTVDVVGLKDWECCGDGGGMIPGVISLHVRDNQPLVLIMSMYHNRPGHVYSLGEPFVVPLNRRRPACYDTRSYTTTSDDSTTDEEGRGKERSGDLHLPKIDE